MPIAPRCLWAFLLGAALIPFLRAEEAAEEEDLCYDRSCYPATGNLLIGRANRLSATSTCGMRGRERYCIVSHLEEKTKCFYCDSRQPWSNREPNKLSHKIENVVTNDYSDRTKNWWQSENGVQNVSIQLDLEAEFHFTHLIMTFRSFRPAALIIERSADFGKTWSIYRYFAYDCASTFPDIPEGPPKAHSDIICSRKYSDVAPSTGGEIIYKVVSPHIHTADPYGQEIAHLLKVTNLRINFTKLHTLGDDLLDYRPEIDEKYYYALYELVVRGSCSCYGHAQRCIPIGNDGVGTTPDMVHGRCECTHNTMGLNCEQCLPFYNDLPWRPAVGTESNECRPCKCNAHANRCHFDQAVYNASGFTSGGVCDDCAHNTMGQNCEQCKPYFYRDPMRPITDPYVCRPCQCDKAGSRNDGICEGEEDPERDLVAGKCYCKSNVDGNNCDRCKNGFWDLREDDPDGCKQCKCNLLGTYGNAGCDKYHGTCHCKRLVEGENCDKCLPEHYGLSEEMDGCKACDCDLGGAFDNNCDIITGTCKCREHFTGRRCNTTESSFYCANIDHHTYEAETSTFSNAKVQTREKKPGEYSSWTGEGFLRVNEGTNMSFAVEDIMTSGPYNLVIRYEMNQDRSIWMDLQISVVRPGDPDPDGPCANLAPSDDFLIARLYGGYKYTEVDTPICLDKDTKYEIRIYMGASRVGGRDISALIDSILLVPPTSSIDIFKDDKNRAHREQYERYQCRHQTLQLVPISDQPQECQRLVCPVAAVMFTKGFECDCDPTGSASGICRPAGGQCECKPNVVGRKCDRCAVGTYGFGPEGCHTCDCDSVGALDNNCDKQSGQCTCRDRSITGRQCNECQPGFWGFPECRVCQCNGHASTCDQKTGACIECRNLTDGHSCDRCKAGYYGDPRLGVNRPCKPCPCPGGPGSGMQHADTCYLQHSSDFASTDVVCNCKTGYTGERCGECALNFWGNPMEIGGSCERCDCNENIDRSIAGSCDAKTGDCLKCLHNTEGAQCENCIEGYFGDAKVRNCQKCVCNTLGTDNSQGACDRVSGQCPCFPNVIGAKCDECAPNHFNLSSGAGCAACACDPTGVVLDHNGEARLDCNHIDGQCHCKPGRGGRTCAECQDLFWGDPVNGDCKPCECDRYGSATAQCHRDNGTCVCRPGSGGPLCNECARGYTGQWPNCQACGECFNDWDRILTGIKGKLDSLIERANNIEDKGVSSQYDAEFEEMEAELESVRGQLEAANISKADIEGLRSKMDALSRDVEGARKMIDERTNRLTKISTDTDLVQEDTKVLNASLLKLSQVADDLNKNATEIRGSDIRGAHEIVRSANEVSKSAQRTINEEAAKLSGAETERVRTNEMLDKNEKDFEAQYNENQEALQEISSTLSLIAKELPSLNKQVCGADAAPCDELCGGPGPSCSHCGTSSCGGSVNKAQQAIDFAKEADEKIGAKQREAEELLKRVRGTAPDVASAKSEADKAMDSVTEHVDAVNKTSTELQELRSKLEAFLNTNRAQPKEVYDLAEEVVNIGIQYSEDQIKDLSDKIRQKLADIKDTDKILAETSGNKTMAKKLQESAELASQRASDVHNLTSAIREALKNTEAALTTAQQKHDENQARLEEERNKLVSSDEKIARLEEQVKNATEHVHKLQNVTDNLKAEYVKITSISKAAATSSATASEITDELEPRKNELLEKYNSVKEQLDQRKSSDDDRKVRASKLRAQIADLHGKIKRDKTEIDSLGKNTDAIEIEIAEYKKKIAALTQDIDSVTRQINQKVDYHATCDA